MNKKFFILLLIIAVLIASCKPAAEDKEVPTKEPKNGEKTGLEGITKEQCKQSGGNWNECGSPCAGTGAEICIQVCQAQCECGGIAGFNCPNGFKCRLSGKIADEMGACIKE